MTRAEAKKEAKKVFDWWQEKHDQIVKEAKQNGTWKGFGLDTNRHLFAELDGEAKRRLERIKEQIDE